MTEPERLKAKKSFGQNFLVNEGAIRAILEYTLDSDAEMILEIGPGPGTLTEGLLADGRPLWAMDLDPEAIGLLERRYAGREHFHLLLGDAVHAPLPEATSLVVVGNLPYNAATPILTRFLLEGIPWKRMVLMFQLEVGLKIQGVPGSKDYGPLSVLTQSMARVSRIMKLGPGSFRPAPKVDSIILRFDPLPEPLPLKQRGALLDLLHRSFAQRRKTLANNWHGWLEAERIQALLGAEGLSPSVRAEAVPVKTWVSLLQRLAS
nr:16S rRNA (adenine(1518)-N(6)/adenine(1519)-N(6))-dimethyltransferase RsmA [uncultured Holophaga sp.]